MTARILPGPVPVSTSNPSYLRTRNARVSGYYATTSSQLSWVFLLCARMLLAILCGIYLISYVLYTATEPVVIFSKQWLFELRGQETGDGKMTSWMHGCMDERMHPEITS